MATRKTNKNDKDVESVDQALSKAQSPVIHVPSKSLLFDFQPDLQKSNLNQTKYETLFQAAKSNAWASRAINVIASSVVANGWKPQPLNPKAQPNRDAEEALLRFISQPNEEDSFEDIIRSIVCDLLTCGNAYLEVPRLSNTAKIRKRLSKALHSIKGLRKDSEYGLIIEDAFDASLQQLDGLPLALFHMDARTVSIQTDEHGRVLTYTQATANGKKIVFNRSEVMHFKLRGIGSSIYGESPLESLEYDLAIDLYRQAYVKAMLENSTKLGYFFSFADAQPDTIARFQEWLNVRARGAVNAGQNVVSEGNLDIKSLPELPIFGEGSSELGDSLKEKIVTCLGVPVAKLGTGDAGSLGGQNQEGANKSFVENTVKPLARMIERQFNLQLIPDFKVVGVEGYGVAILTEDVDILQTRAEMVTGLVNSGIITRNEARVELRQVPYEYQGDVPLIQASSGIVRVKDAEQAQGSMDQVNARLDALAGLVGGTVQNQSSTDEDVPPPQEAKPIVPSAANAKVEKTLTDLANTLLKVIREAK